jgi:alkanesulfonate monooxygenase SsuD/methylene tetrahydromethanopterin reductase-like flavin-dependent oxidoreductase (luciferase family)
MDRRPLPAGRRAQRFSEFVYLADRMLREQETTYEGDFYSVFNARMLPGCVQRPRAELAIAGAGRTALDLAARYGDSWVTWGPTDFSRNYTQCEIHSAVARQLDQLRDACGRVGRSLDELDRIFVITGFTDDRLETARAYLRVAERYAEIGITGLLIHWPRKEMPYAADPALPHRIADEVLADVQKL